MKGKIQNKKRTNVLKKTLVVGYLLLLSATWTLASAQNDNIYMKTKYDKGVFETEAYIETTASSKIMYGIIADIVSHSRRLEIDTLQWALKGLSGYEEGRNLIRIDYEGGRYDPNTKIFDVFIGIYAGIMKKQFKNVQISVLMKSESSINGLQSIEVELFYPNFFLKSAKGTLTIRHAGGRRQFVICSSVRFGWFFNLFISTSNYSAVAEWRIQTVLENLKTEAERRPED